MSRRTLSVTDDIHRYLIEHSVREHEVLARLREATAQMPDAELQIAPEQGQFMALLARLMGARRCIEVGVFTGYPSLAAALRMFNDKLHADQRIDLSLVPIGDGVTLARKR